MVSHDAGDDELLTLHTGRPQFFFDQSIAPLHTSIQQ